MTNKTCVAAAAALLAASAQAAPEDNVPIGEPALATSVVSTNMTRAHTLGFAGAGAIVVIIDTGVQKDHPAFRRADGSSRVTYEACFGSTSGEFKSICPNPGASGNSAGDSALNEPGSGAPKAGCATPQCSHGTHVAGIAAGVDGMAPQAEIASLQVFSYSDGGLATAFSADLVAALSTVYAQARKDTTSNAVVVNIGIQGYKAYGEGWSGACDAYNTAFGQVAAVVKQLYDVGIPVLAPTGNKGLNGAVAFPACLSRVIKVAAAENTATYASAPLRWARSNLAPAVAYAVDGVTPVLWLAPGAPVTSALVGGASGALAGTSQAAPHVAGMYAALKAKEPGWTVPQLNDYIRASASAPVTYNLPTVAGPNPPANPVEFRHVLLPN